jgi:hypothetical protein
MDTQPGSRLSSCFVPRRQPRFQRDHEPVERVLVCFWAFRYSEDASLEEAHSGGLGRPALKSVESRRRRSARHVVEGQRDRRRSRVLRQANPSRGPYAVKPPPFRLRRFVAVCRLSKRPSGSFGRQSESGCRAGTLFGKDGKDRDADQHIPVAFPPGSHVGISYYDACVIPSTALTSTAAMPTGIATFHPMFISWSYRYRGKVPRNQIRA